MAQRPTGKGAATGKGAPTGKSAPTGKGAPEGKGKALHAPLDSGRDPHKDVRMSANEANAGIRRAQAELARRAPKKSAFARYAPFVALPLVLLLVLGTYGYLWFSTATTLSAMAEAAQITQDGDGWVLTSDPPHVSGFPLTVGVTLSNVKVTAPQRWGGWVWQAETLRLSANAWDQHKPHLTPIGHSQLRTAAGTLYDISADSSKVTFLLNGQRAIDGLKVELSNATAQPVGGAPPLQIASLLLTADALPLPLAPPADAHTETYKAALTLSDTVIPQEIAPSVGPMIRQLELSGRLLGPVGEGSLREQITKWRDDGGVAEIDRFYIDWSPLKLAATGTLALDDRMQPVGALSSQIQGFFETVDTLYDARLMRARDATLARVVLGTMAEAKSGVPTLTTPVSLQSGKLILGPVTVMEIPKINWPGPAQVRELPSLRPNYEVDRWGRVVRQE